MPSPVRDMAYMAGGQGGSPPCFLFILGDFLICLDLMLPWQTQELGCSGELGPAFGIPTLGHLWQERQVIRKGLEASLLFLAALGTRA